MYQHLVQEGLDKAAAALQKEAGLSVRNISPPVPQSSHFYETPTNHSTQITHPATPVCKFVVYVSI